MGPAALRGCTLGLRPPTELPPDPRAQQDEGRPFPALFRWSRSGARGPPLEEFVRAPWGHPGGGGGAEATPVLLLRPLPPIPTRQSREGALRSGLQPVSPSGVVGLHPTPLRPASSAARFNLLCEVRLSSVFIYYFRRVSSLCPVGTQWLFRRKIWDSNPPQHACLPSGGGRLLPGVPQRLGAARWGGVGGGRGLCGWSSPLPGLRSGQSRVPAGPALLFLG